MVIISTQLKNLSLVDIAPQVLLQDKAAKSILLALDPELQEVTRDIIHTNFFSRIDELDEQSLNLLAYQLHVDFYDLAYSIDMKRNFIKQSISWHRKKGTAASIIQALKLLDINAVFTPWWKFNGEPYTFKLDAIVAGDFYKTTGKDRLITSILRAVNESKAARSSLVSLHTEIQDYTQSNIYAANISVVKFSIDLGADLSTMNELLLLFEARIFSKLDSQEKAINSALNELRSEVNTKLDIITEMLKWKEFD